MSSIFVNQIKSSTGNEIQIPNGHALRVGNTVVDSNILMPAAAGNGGKIIYSNGTSFVYSDYGASNIIIFTSNGTYFPSAGTKSAFVRVVGGGGGGSCYAETGGSGGFAEGLINLVGVSSVSIQIGQGGGGNYYTGFQGAAGGTTSFGSYLTATGGRGANNPNRHCGGYGGVGSGGLINLYGGGGQGHSYYNAKGGTSYFGGSGPSGHPNGGQYAVNYQDYAAPGAGGANGWSYSYTGARGKDGAVWIMEYK